MIAVLAAVVIGLVAWILVLYNQAPGGVNFPTINWPGGTESEELRSCGDSLQCPEDYLCMYKKNAELGTCVKQRPTTPAKLTCGGIGNLRCPEGYECVYEDDEDVIDRAGECKKR